MRFGPSTHAGLSISQVIAAVAEGTREGSELTGMPTGVVVCLLRHEPALTNQEVTAAACATAGTGVVGLDLAGDELRFPALGPYASMFEQARQSGLGTTVHAGEAAPAEAVVDAVHLLGTRRIGHGSRLADRPDLLAWSSREGLCLEVCPSSNVLTGAAASVQSHPITRFLAAGCRVALGDDDPVTTGGRLSREQLFLRDEAVVTQEQLDRISDASIEAAFCDAGTRDHLRQRAQNQLPRG